MRNSLLTILFLSAFFSAFSQTGNFDYLTTNRRFTIAGRTVKGISNDSIWLIASADSLVTQYAVKGYVDNHFGPGTDNAYNFNPEHFIVSGYDISIRFPQDPGEPLFTGSPSFNFTQQHLNFLDSLMLAVGEDTYLDDRDFYYSQDTLNPIRWKAFTLTTAGTGAATWDSVSKNLNIPVSVSGPGGGTTGNYHLPYNGDSTSYLGGDSALHQLPPTPPPGDSIDYSFTSMTTIYNEAGPGEYTISSSGVTTNKDNFNFPFRQLKSLDVGGWSNGDYVSFANTGSANSTTYTFLRGFIRLKQAVPVIQNLSFEFFKNGVSISNLVSMVNYGLDKSKVNSYQNITIPISAFQFTSNDFDELRLKFGGGSSADGLYLDLFQFQNATAVENKYVTDIHKEPGTDSVKQVIGGQNVFAFIDSAGAAVDTIPLHNQLLQQLAAIQNNTASILLKLSISDTAAMLSPYASKIAANTTAIAGKEPIIAAGTTLQYRRGDKTWQTLNTTAVTEGSNLYYTDTRARAAISVTGSGGSYNSSTGVITLTGGAGSGWLLSGNSINPVTDFIGTTSNNSLRFRTNNQERFRIDSNAITMGLGSSQLSVTGAITATGTITSNTNIISAGHMQARSTLTVNALNNFAPNASAQVEIGATNRGILIPRIAGPTGINQAVTAINVTSGGSGYTSAPTVTVANSAASGTAVVSGGQVTAVNITLANGAVTSAPAVTFSGGGGSGAAATAVIGITEGTFYYCTTHHGIEVFNGTSWQLLTTTTVH